MLTENDLIETYDLNINDQPIAFRAKRPFEQHENILLMQLAQEQVSFTQMVPTFEDRTPDSLRKKYNRIIGSQKKK